MGLYIVVEAMDFGGKSTVCKKLGAAIKARVTAEPFNESPESQAFKAKLVSNTMTKDEEIQGFGVSRVEAFQKVIGPYLKHGRDVISDRNFITSMVYQSDDHVTPSEIFQFNKKLLSSYGFDILPSLVIFIDINHEEFLERLNKAVEEKREVNAKDLMFKDKDVFETYRDKYLRSLDYLVDQFGVNVQILRPDETSLENLLKIVNNFKVAA
ncbi:putative thymidylate kinase [Aeromonas phage PS2]|uniref:dTMP kinase n=1 Tax=Aeromonas phage PS1 TaxID=2591406 RepID=A0A514TUV9_9CAUD|nr:thymidylate kinase [Aeromonas phage PS1]QDJ96770.1 putative thymidylate kinase [Aeromonas phage PS1]QFR59403.1 putative thymidylate kinase [Aeromonas phage PS2]